MKASKDHQRYSVRRPRESASERLKRKFALQRLKGKQK